MTIDNAKMIKFFFKQSTTDPAIYFCQNEKCLQKRGQRAKSYKQDPKKGYSNLRNHLRTCVGEEFEEIYLSHLRDAGGVLDKFVFSSARDSDVFRIIEWVIMRDQPISEIDDSITRSILNVKPICSSSLRRYILSLVPLVEDRIKSALPESFGIMFDGWTRNQIHYVAIFCTYTDKDGKYCETMIACGPLLEEGDLSAEQHYEFLVESLEVYDRTIDNVVCLIGDNCAVNRLFATKAGVPLIGCNSHKFNLAVENWIKDQPNLESGLTAVRDVMRSIRTLKNSAKLRELTHLGALLPNETRWCGKFQMVKRFLHIENLLKNIETLDKLLPTPAQRRALESAVPHFNNFESITVNLQKRGMPISKVRFVFDQICEDYPCMKSHLSIDAEIVHDKAFERAIVKILDNRESQLTSEEKSAVGKLRIDQNVDEIHEVPGSYFTKIDHKRRRLAVAKTQFMNCNFIAATSCSVERLFSAARWVLCTLRNRMSPILFEAILFLKLNRNFWDLKVVASAIKLQPKNRYAELDDDSFYKN